MCNKLILALVGVLISSASYSQTSRYFIQFTDKNNTPYSITQPEQFLSQRAIDRRSNQSIDILERDLPVDPVYTDSLTSIGATVIYTSRWFNAAYVEIDESLISNVYALGFVTDGFETAKKNGNGITNNDVAPSVAKIASSGIDYGITEDGLNMIGVDDMHSLGITGDGVRIAVLDGGFLNANTVGYLSHLFDSNRVVAAYDFVDNDSEVYDEGAHGLNVLSIIAAYEPGTIVGGAYNAEYVLLRTEDGNSEYLGETINWIVGAEYADSIGADVINSSLGYNEFDNATNDFVYADLDGETTFITQAADIAGEVGIVVVTSAGNEGNLSWQKITAPADGDNVLAVGATDGNGNYAPLSSRGPSYDGRVKPDVACKGLGMGYGNTSGTTSIGSGTSLAAPQITGLVAGLREAIPELSAADIREVIKLSSNQYENPDDQLGYGIPNFMGAYKLALTGAQGNVIISSAEIFPNPFSEGKLYLMLSTLEIGEEATVEIINTKGQLVYEETLSEGQLSNELSLDTSQLQRGIYIVKITSVRGVIISKLVKGA